MVDTLEADVCTSQEGFSAGDGGDRVQDDAVVEPAQAVVDRSIG